MLQAQTLIDLADAYGSKALADDFANKVVNKLALDAKELRNLKIALADKKAAEEIADKITLSSPVLSDRTVRVIKDMMIEKDSALDLIAALQS